MLLIVVTVIFGLFFSVIKTSKHFIKNYHETDVNKTFCSYVLNENEPMVEKMEDIGISSSFFPDIKVKFESLQSIPNAIPHNSIIFKQEHLNKLNSSYESSLNNTFIATINNKELSKDQIEFYGKYKKQMKYRLLFAKEYLPYENGFHIIDLYI